MEAFLTRALTKIRDELKGLTQSKNAKKIVESCSESLDALKANPEEQNAAKYFEVLRLACESQHAGATTVALDCIQKLIAYGYLKGTEVIVRPKRAVRSTMDEGEIEVSGEEGAQASLIDIVIETICSCNDFADDGVQLQVIKALLTAITTEHCEVNEASLLRAVRSCYNIHLVSHSLVNKTTAKATLTQVLSYVFQRMETADLALIKKKGTLCEASTAVVIASSEAEAAAASEVAGVEGGGSPAAEADDDSGWPSIEHKNAWLLFRALCKLSMKDAPPRQDTTGGDGGALAVVDPIAVQSKVLSLDLLLSVLRASGPAFRSSDKFVHAIRFYLCVSLLRNCTANVPEVVDVSLQVFVQLIEHFKDHLKAEIEVFITKVFLRILDSENSTFHHKGLVLEVFHTMCQDPTALVEIFLNYDADFESVDLFRQIVDALARCAKAGAHHAEALAAFGGAARRSAAQEGRIRRMGLQGLSVILKSLVQCSNTAAAAGAAAALSPEAAPRAAELDDSVSIPAVETPLSPDPKGLGNDAVEVFDRKQRFKEEQQRGILQFNLKPAKGLQYLEERGHLKHEPREVAKFLHQFRDQLDKTVIGDYLGKEKEYANGFCVRVLHEYIDMMDFDTFLFDEAIRHFLSGFRLPGEAQKIDRMMEKFAERYCIQNKSGVFPSADTAFVLAFSIIMLNTDLHNPAIQDERRMTKQGFRRQVEGIANGGNLPDDFLDSIYDRIKKSPISLKDDDHLRTKAQEAPETALSSVFGATPVEKRRQQAFHLEREDIVKASESLFQISRRLAAKGAAAQAAAAGGDSAAAAAAHAALPTFRRLSGSDVQEMYLRPMFDVAWGPIVGTLSQTLEATANGEVANGQSFFVAGDDSEVVAVCLTTLQDAIHLAASLDMTTARATLVNSLAKFTTLDSVREMKPCHVECIKALLKVAITDGNYLGESWEPILQCVSRLNRLSEAAQGTSTDDLFFSAYYSGGQSIVTHPPAPPAASSRGGGGHGGPMSYGDSLAKLMFGSSSSASSAVKTAEEARAVEESNASHLVAAVDSLADKIDHIFASSTKLDSAGLKHFVTQLSAVAHLELHSGGAKSLRGWEAAGGAADAATASPRVFSLQKLVEVAASNMDMRPRLIWSSVWGVLSNHFTAAGLHPNPRVAMYAIDSLRQLSVKFLTKDELRDFNFQRLFLRPFEAIMRDTKNRDIKELLVVSVDSMVQARLQQLRSGWKTMFAVLGLAAVERSPEIAGPAFACVKRLVSDHFALLVFDFTELVNCLLAFASCRDPQTSLVAVQLLRRCADELGSGAVADAMARDPTLKEGQRPTLNGRATAVDDNQWQLWWPLLYGLAQLVGDARVAVRTAALDALGSTLLAYGGLFSEETWRLIFKGVIFPVMESAWTDGSAFAQAASGCPAHNPEIRVGDGSSFITSTAKQVFAVCIDLFAAFPDVAPTLLHETLALLTESICQEIETLGRIAAHALHELVLRVPPAAPKPVWDMLCEGLALVASRPLPPQLVSHTDAAAATPLDGGSRKRGGGGDDDDDDGGGGGGAGSPFAGASLSMVASDEDASNVSVEATMDAPTSPTRPGAAQAHVGVDNPLVRRSVLTQLVVTLAVQDVLRTVLEAHYLDLEPAHLRVLLDALLSTATAAKQFHADLRLRQQLKAAKLMRFPGSAAASDPLPHLVEQELRAYGLLLDTLGRLLALADRRPPLESGGAGGAGGAGGGGRVLTHVPAMRSPEPDPPSAAAKAWLANVRAHGSIQRGKDGQRVFTLAVQSAGPARVACSNREAGAGDVLVAPWPRGGELRALTAAEVAEAFEPVEAKFGAAGGAAGEAAADEAGDLGSFAASRLTFVFQLVLDEFALKDARAAARSADEAALNAETIVMSPMTVQVLRCLDQCNDSYLDQNRAWILPSLCELIRCRDPEVKMALHHVMAVKLCPILIA